MKKISLNKEWRISTCNIGEWKIEDLNGKETIGCKVPGAVHLALMDAGIIADPMKELNMQECRFIEEKDFWHRISFEVEKDFCQDLVILTFEGVDVNADYYLNNEYLGSSCNAFCPAEFDITGRLKAGTNTLTVRVNEGIQAVKDQGKSIDYMKYSWNQQEPWRTYVRKPQFCYGWDWARRLSTCGIYKPVYIKSYEKACFEDCYISSTLKEDGSATIQIHSSVKELEQGNYKIRYIIYTDEAYEKKKVVASGEAEIDKSLSISLEDPKLWWCNGYGEQYLYQVELELVDVCGQTLDTCSKKHGIRSLSIVQKPIGELGDKTFTFTLNGKPIYAKGANWVPVDQIIGRITPERYETLIRCAVDMNMNMFRIWGGGFYEGDAFFDLCDRLGILVWHDFMFACGYYPDFDEEFLENVRKEAVYQVKDKRGRTCFAGWTGNNENYSMYEGHQKYVEEKFPFYGQKIYEGILAPVCAELDPDREFRLSSPYGGDCADDIKEGDQHFWGIYHESHEQFRDFFRIADSKASFVSEFGMIAPMNLESLKKCCAEEQCFPQSEQWKFHSNEGDNFESLLTQYFGVEKPSKELPVDQYILMGQAIQAEVIRYAFEKYRSEKFLCSGTLFWMYSDCYPTSGWCFVDYYYNKKPLYYYTKRAFAPVSIFFRAYQPNTNQGMKEYETHYRDGEAKVEITLTSDILKDTELDCTVRVMKLDGQELERREIHTAIPENSSVNLCSLNLNDYAEKVDIHDLVVLCTVQEEGKTVAQNRYFPVPFGKLNLEDAKISCEKVILEDCVELTLTSDSYVWLCHLPHEEGVSFDNNDLDLVPGQPVTVKVYGADHQYQFRCLTMNDCLKGRRMNQRI